MIHRIISGMLCDDLFGKIILAYQYLVFTNSKIVTIYIKL